MAQTHYADLLGEIKFTWDSVNKKVTDDLNSDQDKIDKLLSANYKNGVVELVQFVKILNGIGIISKLSDFDRFKKHFSSWNEELACIVEAAGKNVIIGTTYNFSFTGTDSDEVIVGGDDNDVINGGVGNDTIAGGAGNDTINNIVYDRYRDYTESGINKVHSNLKYKFGNRHF